MEGSMDSLATLHAAVPAAEALDLSEQARLDRWAARFAELAELATAPLATEPAVTDDGEDLDDAAPAADALTPGQVLGLLEHQLGATEIG